MMYVFESKGQALTFTLLVRNIISIDIMPSCHQELLKQPPNYEKPLKMLTLPKKPDFSELLISKAY